MGRRRAESLVASRSYVRVADKYGISEGAVRHHARANDWEAKAVDARALVKAERTLTADRAKAIAATLAVVDLARRELLEKLKSGQAEVRLSDLPALVRLEQLLTGGATDRIEVVQVREYVRLLVERVGVLVPQERLGEYVALVESVARELDRANGLPELEPPADGGA
jgi:hypothetical protein